MTQLNQKQDAEAIDLAVADPHDPHDPHDIDDDDQNRVSAISDDTDTDAQRKAQGEQPCADVPLAARIEALLLASDHPMTEARLAGLLGLGGAGTAKSIRAAIEELNRSYDETGRSFRATKVAGGWRLLTEAKFGPLLAAAHRERQQTKLSRAALETLSIIAYRQPILRAEIEAIRGVASGEVLRGLLERRLVKVVGRAEELGRPMLYGTTGQFLRVFGLGAISDLPRVEGLEPPKRLTPIVAKPAVDSGTDESANDQAADTQAADSAAGASESTSAETSPSPGEDASTEGGAPVV